MNNNSFYDQILQNRNRKDESHDLKDSNYDAILDSYAHKEHTEDEENSLNKESITNEINLSDGSPKIPHEARQALVYLMRQGVVLASQNPKVFAVICRYIFFIRQHLADVYLQLILDEANGIAFIATKESEFTSQEICEADENVVESEDDSANTRSLITKRPLTLIDTLILLVLRKHYQERETAGEQKIIIDIERLESYLVPFMPITEHASLERKKLMARLNEFKKRKLLSAVRGSEDRFELTPLIRYVVSANFLTTLLSEYESLAKEKTEE
ncbi:DUF4194 domain-containing protein [Thorsellia kenyensis]|uniref:DUF4194 domain-containing protein n=1 Tax=Thorsellia kenyensis TaxID=1549888 RepID=A0ABV6C8G1_9GAMM